MGSRLKKYNEAKSAAYDKQIADVQKGSDVARLATGNESAGLRGGPVMKSVQGERFIAERNKADETWIKRQKAEAAQSKPSASVEATMQDVMMKSPGGTGSSLKHMIKEMNLQQRTSGATGGQSVAMNGGRARANQKDAGAGTAA